MQLIVDKKAHRLLPLLALALATAVLVLLARGSLADTNGGFEIDAFDPDPDNAMYSGQSGDPIKGDDWAQGPTGKGVFVATPAGGTPTAADDCYGSDIDVNPTLGGLPTFICDGNADSKFGTGGGAILPEPELNIVSPSGDVQPDDSTLPVTPGSNPGKDDFSHAYFLSRKADSSCDGDTSPDDSFFNMAGHRGGNEGDAFWMFELDQVPPAGFDDLKDNTGATFDLVFQHDTGLVDTNGDPILAPGRTGDGAGAGADDVAITFELTNGGAITLLRVYRWNQANLTESTLGSFEEITAPFPCASDPSAPGDTALQDNQLLADGSDKQTQADEHSIEAPPWNVPACDPTPGNSPEYGAVGDGGGNVCRLARQGQSHHLLPTADFAEASVDLGAFGITEICFSSIVFMSISSSTLSNADVKDIGGGGVNICGTKSGVKFHDLNANGSKDAGEPNLSGWTINLYGDANGNGDLDAGETTPLASDVTNGSGSYSFGDLFPGDYIVCEVISGQTGYIQSAPNSGTTFPPGESLADCSLDSSLGDNGYAFTLGVADSKTGNDFGNYKPGSKSGEKFIDLDADGQPKEAGEDCSNFPSPSVNNAGCQGVTIHIQCTAGACGTYHSHTTTDAGGEYSFTGLTPGTYLVCEEAPSPFVQSYPTSGANCTGHAANAGGTVGAVGYSFTLSSNGSHTGNDFGNYRPATKSGVKFLDRNADGVRDADGADDVPGNGDDEVGLENFEIHLFGTAGGGGSVHLHDTTDGAGAYSFSVKPGSYVVCESPQPVVGTGGYRQTAPASGAGIVDCDSTNASLGLPHPAGGGTPTGVGGAPTGNGYQITLTSGQIDSNNDFGNARGSLLIEKRAKSASANGCTLATSPTPSNSNCPLFGGATFKITPNPLTGTGTLTLTDNVSSADADSRAGFVCIEGVILDAPYTFEEANSNNANYAKDMATPTFTPHSAADCASRAAATSGDVSFFNTPLSVIRVTFGSLADGGLGNQGVTKSTIECTGLVKDSSQTPPGDNVGDATPATFDDVEEIFTGLIPGTYNCQIVIDP